jgi:hypothetical protein
MDHGRGKSNEFASAQPVETGISHGKPGHNSGDPNGGRTLEARRQAFKDAITRYIGEMNLAEAWGREELAQARGVQRMLALRHGHAAALIRGCRRNPQDDAKYGVLGLIHYLSDNDEGSCTLSQRRMGEVLLRSERTIRDCISRLEEDGSIWVDRVSGLGTRYTPLGHVSLLEVGDVHPVWVIDALSASPKRHGRPPKLTLIVSNDQPRKHASPLFLENPGSMTPGLLEKPRKHDAENPGSIASTTQTHHRTRNHIETAHKNAPKTAEKKSDTSLIDFTVVVAEESASASRNKIARTDGVEPGSISAETGGRAFYTTLAFVTDEHEVAYHRLMGQSGQKPGAISFANNALERSFTDRNMRTAIRAALLLCQDRPEVLPVAVDQALEFCAMNPPGRGGNGAKSVASYFSKTLCGIVGDLVAGCQAGDVARQNLEKLAAVKVENEKAVGAARVSRGAARRTPARDAPSGEETARIRAEMDAEIAAAARMNDEARRGR